MAIVDLSISKNNIQNPVPAGGTISYTIAVVNNGPSTASNVVITDTVPAGIQTPQYSLDSGATWATWPGSLNLGTIPVGTPQTMQLRGVLQSSVGGTISNTAHVSTTDTDTNTTNDTSTVITQVNASADMSIVKTAAQNPVVAGTTINYNLVVSNAGPSDAQSVVISDSIPASIQTPQYSMDGGTTWSIWNGSVSISTVTASASQTIMLRGVINSSVTTTITNTATVSSGTTDPNLNDNTSTVATEVNSLADLVIVKSVTPVSVPPGSTITYDLTINNKGPSDAQNVIVYDAVPTIVQTQQYSLDAGTTWLAWGGNIGLGTIVAQATTIVKIRGIVSPLATTTIINTATITSITADPYPITNTSTTTTPISILADLKITKTAMPSPVVAGTTLNYTLIISNTGPNQALNVMVNDTVPTSILTPQYSIDGGSTWLVWNGSLSVGTLAVGAVQTISIQGKVSSASTTTIVNIATITSTTTDPDITDNTAVVLTPVNTSADLEIVKTSLQNPVVAGGSVSYNLMVTNNGPSDALGVVVSDTLPVSIQIPKYSIDGGTTWNVWTGSINLGTLAVTVTKNVMIKGNVAAAAAAGTLTNTARVTSTTSDPDPNNNTSTAITQMNNLADIYVTKTVLQNPVVAGATINYNLLVGNNGPSDASNVIVNDVLPTTIAIPKYSLDGGNTWLAWNGSLNLGTLAAASSLTIQISGGIDGSAVGVITNTATITSTINDPNLTNNTSTVTTPITNIADVFIMMTESPNPVLVNDIIQYQLLVGNNGPSNASSVMVMDTIPIGISNPQYSMDGGSTWLAWPGSIALGTLVATNSISVFIKGIVNASAKGIITNEAVVTTTSQDPNLNNNTAITQTRFSNPRPGKKEVIQDLLPETANYFKEEMICEILSIPPEKPDVERILDVMAWAEVVKTNLIQTPKGKSFEGQNLTGVKLVVELCLKEKVTYVANEATQKAHAAHYETLTSMFVILPEMINGRNTCDLIRAGKVAITPYVEGICTRMIDERTLHKCVMILVDVKM